MKQFGEFVFAMIVMVPTAVLSGWVLSVLWEGKVKEMRCLHKDAEITEVRIIRSAITQTLREGGDDEGNTYVRTEVYCPDCDLFKIYYKKLPSG